MKTHTPLPHRLLAALLAAALLPLTQFPALADEGTTPASGGSIASNALSGIASALQGANSFAGTFGASAFQLQGLASQMIGLQQQTALLQNPQNALLQSQVALNSVLGEAQVCLNGANHDYSKYKKANIKPTRLGAIIPTCQNYGRILDTIGKTQEQLQDERKKMACLQTMQNKVNQIAEQTKAAMQQLSTAAGDVWNTYDQVITIHKQAADKIKQEVDGQDGKGGYREALRSLKSLNIKLNSVLNGAPGPAKEGEMPTGLAKQVDLIRDRRVKTANDWYYSMMGQVQSCFNSDATFECFNGVGMPPSQCLLASLSNSGTYDSGTGTRNRTNQGRLGQVFLLNYGKITKADLPASLDVKNKDTFLSFVQARFNNMLSQAEQGLMSQSFSGKVDKSAMRAMMDRAYTRCYEQARAQFDADTSQKLGNNPVAGGPYSASLKEITDNEKQLANDIKTTVDLVEGQMSDFRTQFHKVYNSDLPQFAGDCTTDDDPYKSLDCLRVLKAQLNSGIKGTAQTFTLSNGSKSTIDAGLTNLSVDTLSLDAQGKPVQGTASIQCKGFDDCVNFLDRSRMSHESEVQKQTLERDKFVNNHNRAFDAALSGFSGQFAQMGSLIASYTGQMSQNLIALGLHGAIRTKQAEGESLEKDDTTKMFKMPKSMKAAMAGKAGYTELDNESLSDVVNSYNDLARTMNEKAAEAGKMKQKCLVRKGDYEALANFMPSDCNARTVCSDKTVSSISGRLSAILYNSQNIPEDDYNSTSRNSFYSTTEYNSCRREIIADANDVPENEVMSKYASMTKDAENKEEINQFKYNTARGIVQSSRRAQAKVDAKDQCINVLFNPLNSLIGKSRDALKDDNNRMMVALKKVVDACTPDPDAAKEKNDGTASSTAGIDPDEVESACQDFRKAANGVNPPTNEEESRVDDSTDKEISPSIVNPLTTPTSIVK